MGQVERNLAFPNSFQGVPDDNLVCHCSKDSDFPASALGLSLFSDLKDTFPVFTSPSELLAFFTEKRETGKPLSRFTFVPAINT